MKFGRARKEDKLYKQWAKYDGLPPEALPQKENSREMPAGGERKGRGLGILFIVLIIGILLLGAGLVLLLTQGG